MKYIYAALFEVAEECGYAVSFPDLPGCYSQGDTLSDALEMAQIALTEWIEFLTDKCRIIPEPSNIKDIEVGVNSFVNLICADMRDGRAVKRTVSLPKWMDDKVSESGLSLSRVLQDALSQRLG